MPGYFGGTLAQRNDLRCQRRHVAVLALPTVVGGIIGGGPLLRTGAAFFDELVPWLILPATALLTAEPWLGRTVARRLRSPTAGKHANPVVVGVSAFIGALYGGYFGAGLGIILLARFSFVLPESLGRVSALKQIASLLANGAAAILFVATGNVVWSAAAIMAAGALLGGSLDGRFADKVRASTLRGMVIALALAIALAFLFR